MDLDDAAAAYHEAGHVLIAHLLGGHVVESSIESEFDGHRGHTAVEWQRVDDAEFGACSALVALAGPVAETLWSGDEPDQDVLAAWQRDQDEVEAALVRSVEEDAREATRRAWIEQVVERLRDDVTWERLCRIADHLEAHGSLDRTLLEDVLP